VAIGDAIPLRGNNGVIKWFYYAAADVREFTVLYDKTAGAWTLRGIVQAADAFKLKQTPLVFVAALRGDVLRWPVLGFELTNGRIVARLGAPGSDLAKHVALRAT